MATMEWMDKYNEASRHQTAASIDRPMILFLGLTPQDLVLGASAFMGVVFWVESGLSFPLSLFAGGGSITISKLIREKLPPRFFQHLLWSLGVLSPRHVPKIFYPWDHHEVFYGP